MNKRVKCICGALTPLSYTNTFCSACNSMLIDEENGATVALDRTYVDPDYKPYTPPPYVPPPAPEKPKSLRDEFAMAALNALVCSHEFGAQLKRIYDPEEQIAKAGDKNESPQMYLGRIAYSIADAMLNARKD